jgi:hypothetical protein
VGQFEIWPAGLFSLKGNCLHRAALAQPRPFMADKPLSAPERYREEARKLRLASLSHSTRLKFARDPLLSLLRGREAGNHLRPRRCHDMNGEAAVGLLDDAVGQRVLLPAHRLNMASRRESPKRESRAENSN